MPVPINSDFSIVSARDAPLSCQVSHLVEHISDENAVTYSGIVDKDVGAAPTSLALRRMGLPDRSVDKKRQLFLTENSQKRHTVILAVRLGYTVVF